MNTSLDPAAIQAAKDTLSQLMKLHAHCITFLSLADAVQWLEVQLPDLRDLVALLTWANAIEQLADDLPADQVLWKQALQTEGYALRLRARALTTGGNTYTA